MRLTPLDIRQQQFTVRMFRGLDPQEVDAFLEDVAEDYESVLKENGLLREQLSALEERSRGLVDREKALQDTLLTTQRLAEEMKESARREAQLIMREAELRGDKYVEDLRAEEAHIRGQINELKRARRQVAEDLRATLDRYHRLFTLDLADDDAKDGDAR
ncbi:MAG TPA: DivIVA domain-containing protein [Methylomirabilota bacterium]|nr:DivIVA domain-containing protein [Methylomirabilota bacterium]